MKQMQFQFADETVAAIPGFEGLYALDSPGMPPAGPSFLREVANRCAADTTFKKTNKGVLYQPGPLLQELYARALREPGFTLNVEVRGGQFRSAVFIPGHIWGQHTVDWQGSQVDTSTLSDAVMGPRPARVMVLGKMPWQDEINAGRNLVGASGEILVDMLCKLHLDKERQNWYITNLIKFMPPDRSSTLRAGWIADCLPLLHQELRIVRPDYIVCLGADASKALLGPKKTVKYMEGRVEELSFPVHRHHDDEPEIHKALCMTVLHPAQVAREPSTARTLERGLSRLSLLVSGARFDQEEADLDHRVCESFEEAVDWVQEMRLFYKDLPPRERLLAVDAEWEGQHPINKGAHICTIQMSWAEKHAICFHLHNEEGKVVFRDRDDRPAIKRLATLLTEFVQDKRLVGHFFVSDLEHLTHHGFNFRKAFEVPLDDAPDGTLAWQRLMNGEGGLDTAMMAHAIEETTPLGLEALAMRYTTVPRYDTVLEDAVVALCKELGIKRGALEGYGKVPRNVLLSYSMYDADATMRLVKALIPLLDFDYTGNNCWEPFWESMIIQPVILDMHMNGICVDRERIDDLTIKFMTARARQEEQVKQAARWDDFNIRSVQHVREYLFGEELNGRVIRELAPEIKKEGKSKNKKKPSRVKRVRPPEAISLRVIPLLDTSKPPKQWADIVRDEKEKESSPSTGKQVLAMLAQDNPEMADQIYGIRDYRFLDQVLKSMLRPPEADEDTGEWLRDEDTDGFVYEAGLASCIDDDGRVRTHLYPTAETGRWKSARPQLHNLSKTRDPDYERLLGKENYKTKLRSVLRAAPGKVLMEFDYIGAELLGMAVMSGDKNMIDHAYRNQLVEDDPRYYDIHSNVAKLAFKLDCAPTKSGLKAIGKAHIRNVAKTVVFGVAYGRGAKAIAMAAREQGVDITTDEAQQVIDTLFRMYPGLLDFFSAARDRALNEGWLCHCFGRFRRFPHTEDRKLQGDFERQGMNYPIQGMIASALDRGLARLRQGLLDAGLYKEVNMLLSVHDAGLLETPPQHVSYLEELVRWSMCKMVPIYPTTLDGMPIEGRGPYYLDVDFSVSEWWGETLTTERCEELGVPAKFGKHNHG